MRGTAEAVTLPTGRSMSEGQLGMEFRSSWWTFAGFMVLVGGFLNGFDGLVAITQSRYIERNIGGELPITNDVKTWGWVALIIGALMVLTAMGIFAGATWAGWWESVLPARISSSSLRTLVTILSGPSR